MSRERLTVSPAEILLPKEPLPFAKEELVEFGNIPLVCATWGQLFTKEDLFNHFQGTSYLTEAGREMVEKVGFDGGYRYPWDFDGKSEKDAPEYHRRQAIYAAELAGKAAEARNWNRIDILVVASLSSRADVAQKAAEILKDKRILVKDSFFYGQACNGAQAALVDLSRIEELRDKKSRAVVVGIETLTGGLVDRNDIPIIATFSNGGAAVAWIVGQEIEVITGKTIVEQDVGGVIRVPTDYELPPDGEERLRPYEWYKFVNPRQQILDYVSAADRINQYFAMTQNGIFLAMPEPDGGYTQMNGWETIKYFLARMPNLVADVQETYERDFLKKSGPLHQVAIYHPASKPVMEGVINKYKRLVKAKNLVTEIQFPWLMEGTGFANVSAASSLIQWAEMVKKGLLEQDKPTMLVSMGIGSVRQAWVVKFGR